MSQVRLRVLLLALFVGVQPATPARPAQWHLPASTNALVGESRAVTALPGDSLHSIAQRHGMGVWEMQLANPGVDPWQVQAGQGVIVPGRELLPAAPRQGIVINLADMRLYHFSHDQVAAYAVGIGQQGWDTPAGRFHIVEKQVAPWWYPPESIRHKRRQQGRKLAAAYPPGPGNPLGSHALRLNRTRYLIHGTNSPHGVGLPVSHGCIRLYSEDIATLYASATEGERVTIVNQPIKVGWNRNRLYLELHRSPTIGESDVLELPEPVPANLTTAGAGTAPSAGRAWPIVNPLPAEDLVRRVQREIAAAILAYRQRHLGAQVLVSGTAIRRALRQVNGIPVAVAVAQRP